MSDERQRVSEEQEPETRNFLTPDPRPPTSVVRVLHINTERSWRGGEAQVLLLAKGLQERGYSVSIVAQPDGALKERAIKEGVRVIPLRMRGEFDLIALFRLAKIMREEKVDIVHMHDSHAVTLGNFAARLAGIPTAVASRRVNFSTKRNRFRKLKYLWGIKRIIAVSQEIKESLINDRFPPDFIEVIHSGIDLSKFQEKPPQINLYHELGLDPERPLIGNIAHLAPHKGHCDFLKAAEVCHMTPEAQFVIVGDGPLRRELLDWIKAHQLDEKVIFTGFKEDIAEIIPLFDMLVLSSISGEGSPAVIKEAMALGKPVIATDVGGVREILEDGISGILIPPGQPMALANAILDLMKNQPKRKMIGLAGKDRVKLFSSSRMVCKTEKLYKSFVKG
ncbi:MAG: glycosyltransferase [Candidatus Tectomicrobia bacterium]|nr:glycosyltransferase [Candidatus Tectomicrobia bacterium]